MNRIINAKEFREKVLGQRGLSIVKFFTEWSGTCQMLLPVYEELALTYRSEIKFFSINAETDNQLKDQYGVRELPTIFFFLNGQIVDHVAGMISRNALIAKVENNLSAIKN